MMPAQFSYAFWRMKSAESSGGWAPLMLAMQLGALSMMAGMPGLLGTVAPALGAHGPLHGPADHGGQDQQRDREAQHVTSSASGTGDRARRRAPARAPSRSRRACRRARSPPRR